MNTLLKHALLTCALCAATAGSAGAKAGQGTTPRQVSATRPMAEFSARESELATALHKRDHAGIDRLLSNDFEFRSPQDANEVARADWIANPASGAASELSGLAVHEFPALAIASFTRNQSSGECSYVVDVWTKQTTGWQLLARYETSLPPAAGNAQDVAPTGKG